MDQMKSTPKSVKLITSSDFSEKMGGDLLMDGSTEMLSGYDEAQYDQSNDVAIVDESEQELFPLNAYESSIYALKAYNSLWHSNMDWAASHIMNTVRSEEAICEYLIAMEPRILEVSMEEVEDVAHNGRDAYADCVHHMRDAESELSHHLRHLAERKQWLQWMTLLLLSLTVLL